jgi:carbamoyl-phosphate synthase small subunit
MKAILVLEDGFALEGFNFGAEGETFGEVVFNTSMTGYQEILTDPSYKGQIVTMTYPLIGNYGVNLEDAENAHPWVEGFVVKELSALSSNWRKQQDLDSYLKKFGIVGIQGLDTRALTRHIRLQGAMRGAISTVTLDKKELMGKVNAYPKMEGRDLVKDVTCEKEFHWQDKKIDFND